MIDHIDPISRLIYLDATTVDATISPLGIYQEMRALRRTTLILRGYDVFCKMGGSVPKNPSGSKRTERYLILLGGTQIVPYDTSHTLTVSGTVITDTGLEGVQVFNTLNLSAGVAVNINYTPKQVEVIVVNTGGGGTLTQVEHDKLLSLNNYSTLHADLDSYVNKGSWKADNTAVINAINVLKTLEPDERTALLALVNYDDTVIQGMLNNVPANIMNELV